MRDDNLSEVGLAEVYSPEIIDALNISSNLFDLVPKYSNPPYWFRMCIKRKYSNHPAVWIDWMELDRACTGNRDRYL